MAIQKLKPTDIQFGEKFDPQKLRRLNDEFRSISRTINQVIDMLADAENNGGAFEHVLATTAGLGGSHTVDGLSDGMVLAATGAETAAFRFLDLNNLGDVSVDAAEEGQVLVRSGALWIAEHLPLTNLADPGADFIVYWNESAGELDYLTLGSGLLITAGMLVLDSSALDHGSLSGLDADDHPQYAAIAQNEAITGQWSFQNETEVRIGGVQQWHVDGTAVTQTVPLVINVGAGSGSDIIAFQINNTDTSAGGGGIDFRTFSTITPGTVDTGNQIGLWEGSGRAPTSAATGFRWRHEGDEDLAGDLVFYSHEASATGLEVYRHHRNLAQMAFIQGSAAAPTLTFKGDLDTGIFSNTVDGVNIATAGTSRFGVDTAQFRFTLPLRSNDGSAAAPTYTFNLSNTSGFYRIGADNIGLSTAGTLRWDINTTRVQQTIPLNLPNGAVGAPSLAFTSETTLGLFRRGTNDLGIAAQNTRHVSAATSGAGVIETAIEIQHTLTTGFETLSFVDNAGTRRMNLAFGNSASGQPNLGFIHMPSGDDFLLRTSGTERWRMLGATGNLRAADNVELQLGAGPDLRLFHDATNSSVRNDTGDLIFLAGATERFRMTASTAALSVTGTANQLGILVTANATASQSFGQRINGGTNSSDYALLISDQTAATDYLRVRGDGRTHFHDGSAALPSIAFLSDTDTGLYWIGANNLGISIGGTLRFDLSTTALTATLPHLGAAGSSAAPQYSFTGDTDTGLFQQAADAVGIATGATEVARFDANATAGNTRFLVYDVDNATLERVSVGAADSGGAGFKVLRIPN